jgi:hypothetical protein
MALRPLNSIAGFSTGDPAIQIIQANGDITTINFTANGLSNLGPVSNVTITGGTSGQALTTDGNGNLSFSTISTESNRAAPMPYLIPTGESYIVNENFQGLYTQEIVIDGELTVDGMLIEIQDSIQSDETQVLFDTNGTATGNTGFTFLAYNGNLNVPGNINVNGGIFPAINDVYDLGSPNLRWGDGYFGGNTVYIGNSSISVDANGYIVITNNLGGTFVVEGSAAASTAEIENGSSSVYVYNNSNVAFTVAGTSNVMVVHLNGIDLPGAVSAGSVKTNNLYYANGQPWNFGQDPGGSNTQIQFNDNGNFAGSSNFTFNKTTNTVSVSNLSVSGNALISGNLSVDGNLIYINVEELSIEDPIINLQTGANGAPPASNTGKDVGTALNYYDTQARIAFMGWDTSNAEFAFGSQTTITNEVVAFNTLGNVRAQTFKGNVEATTISGSLTTASQANITTVGTLSSLAVSGNVTAGNISGANTIAANYLVSNSGCVSVNGALIAFNSATGSAGIFSTTATDINFGLSANITMGSTAGDTTVRGNLIANNFTTTGNISANLITGTLTTAAQANITTVGTLGNLTVTGNISGNVTTSNTVITETVVGKRSVVDVTTLTVVDSFPASAYRTAKYVVSSQNDDGYESLEVLLIHNDINSYVTVYGAINDGGGNTVTLSTGINSGNVELRATGLAGNTQIKLIGTYVPVI